MNNPSAHVLTCTKCRHSIPFSSKFCMECGASVVHEPQAVGTWKLSAIAGEDGRRTDEFGIHYGHIVDLASKFADQCSWRKLDATFISPDRTPAAQVASLKVPQELAVTVYTADGNKMNTSNIPYLFKDDTDKTATTRTLKNDTLTLKFTRRMPV